MGDFDACRFDFRIDNKNGLTPSKRKRAFKRSVYSTLFKCKTCGLLFDGRPALLEHKLLHSIHPCTFCDMKFKKKSLLREHVNTAHYIDKLKAGYKTEYGRTKATETPDVPPLIPAGDVNDGRPQTMVGSNYVFGSDAMATSSPVQLTPPLEEPSHDLHQPITDHLLSADTDGTLHPGHDSDTEGMSPYLFPGFPFGGMPNIVPSLPTLPSSHVTSTSTQSRHTPSALQTAMASFFPFSNMTAATNKPISTKPAVPSSDNTAVPVPSSDNTAVPAPSSGLVNTTVTSIQALGEKMSQREIVPTNMISPNKETMYSPNKDHLDTNDDVIALRSAYTDSNMSPLHLPTGVPSTSISPKPPAYRLSKTDENISPVNPTIHDLSILSESKPGSDSGFCSFNQSGNGCVSPQSSIASFISNLQAKSVGSDNPLSLLPKTSPVKTTEVLPRDTAIEHKHPAMLTSPPAIPSKNINPIQTTIGAVLEAVTSKKPKPLHGLDGSKNVPILPKQQQQVLPNLSSPPYAITSAVTSSPPTPSTSIAPVLTPDPSTGLPQGYMMMTLVVTSQPGGGIAAVPLIPGYTYPMLSNQPITTASAQDNLPPLMSVSSTVSKTTNMPVPSAVIPSILNTPGALLKSGHDLEPGEISKVDPNTSLTTGVVQSSQSTNLTTGVVQSSQSTNLTTRAIQSSQSKPISVTSMSQNNSLPNVLYPIGSLQQSQSLYTAPKISGPVEQTLSLPPKISGSIEQSTSTSIPARNTQLSKGLGLSQGQESQLSASTGSQMSTGIGSQIMSSNLYQLMQSLPMMVDTSNKISSQSNKPTNSMLTNQSNTQKESESKQQMIFPEVQRVGKKRKQSCPARTLHKTPQKDESQGVLDLSAKPDDMDLGDKGDLDRVTQLERYISQDGGLDQGGQDTPCDLCDMVCENVYMLNKHKAKIHKTGLGLSKMVDRLWQTKKDPRKRDDRSRESSVTPTLQRDTIEKEEIHSLQKVQNGNNNNSQLDGSKTVVTESVKEPEALIADTARQVYMEMMTAALKSPIMSQQSGSGISSGPNDNVAGPLIVSECETNSGIFGHYRIKKPKLDDYCTFKFHTCKVCKQLFNTAEEMWDHALIHKELQRFKCSTKGCNYSSASRDKLIQHKSYVHQQHTVLNDTATMEEFNMIGQQIHYPCEFQGCDSVFFVPGELVKHVDRYHQKFQCPEGTCNKTFYTMGGLKTHQMSHLEDSSKHRVGQTTLVTPLKGRQTTPAAPLMGRQTTPAAPLMGRQTTPAAPLKGRQTTPAFPSVPSAREISTQPIVNNQKTAADSSQKPLICPLCKYAAQHRSSMNQHMKSRHRLDKLKTGHNSTVYVDGGGNMVCSFRTEYFTGGDDYSESSSCGADSPTAVVMDTEPTSSAINTTTDAVAMDTTTDGVQIMKNEPEEITVSDNNTIETSDGTIVPPHPSYNTELVYVNNDDNDQPLDFSMKKQTSVNTNNSNNEVKDTENTGKTPVGIVQPYMHIPSVTPNIYTPQFPFLGGVPTADMGGASNVGAGNETPPLPQLVPMANPFTYLPQQSVGSPFFSHNGSPLTSSSSTPTSTGSSDGQFFNFKLKSKRKRQSNTSKTDEPINYPCKHCAKIFECAEIMWQHKLKDHPEIAKIYCDTCGFDTMDQAELQSHMMCTHGREVGDNKAFMCFICSKGYSSKLGLNHHLMRHSDGGPPQFPCPYRGCDSVLHSRGALGNHVKRVHLKPTAKQTVIDESKQVFYCDYPRCDRSFRESKHLRVHRMTHTDEKPLKCHVCDYSCRQRNSLNWHMKSKHGLEKRVSVDGRTVYV